MAYWSIAVLVLSISFLAYKHPPAVAANSLPQWLRPAKRRTSDNGKHASNARSYDEEDDVIVESEVKLELHEPSELESTPKAMPAGPNGYIPTFSLDETATSQAVENVSQAKKTDRPTSPPANGTRLVTSMPPPPNSTPKAPDRSAASLTPPPARPPPPNTTASLRIPSTGPLPNRGPPPNSQQRANGGLTTTTTIPTPANARSKVLLSPGHSPMDWAALTNTRSNNLSGVSTFQRVPPSILRTKTGRKGKPAWSSWQGKVYNITPYLPFHPGGEDQLMRAAGRDGGKLFMEVHPWVNWENMLGACLVGVMVPEGSGDGEGLEGLD